MRQTAPSRRSLRSLLGVTGDGEVSGYAFTAVPLGGAGASHLLRGPRRGAQL